MPNWGRVSPIVSFRGGERLKDPETQKPQKKNQPEERKWRMIPQNEKEKKTWGSRVNTSRGGGVSNTGKRGPGVIADSRYISLERGVTRVGGGGEKSDSGGGP